MPTLLDDSALEIVQEVAIEEFDLERLARISGMQPDDAPSPAPRFRVRQTLAALLLAAMFVSGLAPLRAASSVSLHAITRACSFGN
jgi:hypothetical protein